MYQADEFSPDWVSPPGDTMRDLLASRGLSLSDFASAARLPLDRVQDLLIGRESISIDLARRLNKVLGCSVEFWMNRDFQFRSDSARLAIQGREWIGGLPVNDMINYGWVNRTGDIEDQINECLRFFNAANTAVWKTRVASIEQNIAFRTSPSFESNVGALSTWLRRGEIEAQSIKSETWNPRAFAKTLIDIRGLTRNRRPADFLPKLQQLCAACGVAVVVVRAPSGCRASGATRFLDSGKAVIQLSARYLTDDQFWFTFFHEASHLLLHGTSDLFLEGFEATDDSQEREANDYAMNLLIPEEHRRRLHETPLDAKSLIRFAGDLGISCGIVVGQLQHLGRIPHSKMNSLKRRYAWPERS